MPLNIKPFEKALVAIKKFKKHMMSLTGLNVLAEAYRKGTIDAMNNDISKLKTALREARTKK